MSRWAFVADVHIGNHALFAQPTDVPGMNTRARRVLDALYHAVTVANQEKCTHFCVLGDLFDVSKPNPMLVAETMCVLREFAGTIVLLRGNHDMVSEGESILDVFRYTEDIEVVSTPRLIDKVVLVPYTAREPMEHVVRRLQKSRIDWTCMGVHAGLLDGSTPPWLREAADAVPVAMLDMRTLTLAGNWHDRKKWLRTNDTPVAVQCGALVPTGFDNAFAEGETGMVTIVEVSEDAAEVTREIQVDATRFVQERWNNGRGVPPNDPDVFYRFIVTPEEHLAAQAALRVSEVKYAGYDFKIERAEVLEAKQAATRAASAAGGFGEAVEAYVSRMPLDPGVERTAVLNAVRRFARLGAQ